MALAVQFWGQNLHSEHKRIVATQLVEMQYPGNLKIS